MEPSQDGARGRSGNFLKFGGIAIAGFLLFGLILLFLSSVSANVDPTVSADAAEGWTVVFTETFESPISLAWTVADLNGTTDGEYYWATTAFTSSQGTQSAWATGGGDGGVLTPGTSDYPNGAMSSMVHAPVDIQEASYARLTFDYWVKTEPSIGEPSLDVLQARASVDGSTFDVVAQFSGDSGGWRSAEVNLQDYVGSATLWIEFFFTSDASVVDKGVFIDNISLETRTAEPVYLPFAFELPTATPTSTPTPTPTPPWYYRDDFSDSSSGWPIVDHTFDKQDCFKWFYSTNQTYRGDICDDRTDVKVSPVVPLPNGDYEIIVDARFHAPSDWWTSYGIMFDAKDDPDPNKSDLGDYYMVWVLWEGTGKFKWKILEDCQGSGCQKDVTSWKVLDRSYFNYGSDGTAWNKWHIKRTSSTIQVLVNDFLLASVNKARPTTNNQILFGVFNSTYETGFNQVEFDNYQVDELGGRTVWSGMPESKGEGIYEAGPFSLEALLPKPGE